MDKNVRFHGEQRVPLVWQTHLGQCFQKNHELQQMVAGNQVQQPTLIFLMNEKQSRNLESGGSRRKIMRKAKGDAVNSRVPENENKAMG